MPFDSGRVSYCRFRVQGDVQPKRDVLALLETLGEHAFQETEIGTPSEVESGWVAGDHIYDTQFGYEKNIFGAVGSELVHFALRLDTHKPPADIKRAYKQINEQAAASGNPSGFASKAQKRDAADLAQRQIHEDLAAGKFRRSKMVPLLWDISSQIIYCSATGTAVSEQLCRRFQETFDVSLQPESAGTIAASVLVGKGLSRDFEDLTPGAYTEPPEDAAAESDDEGPARDAGTPVLPWITGAVDTKDFLGNELLLWLWWRFETAEGLVEVQRDSGAGKEELALVIDRVLDMDCAWDVRGKQTLRAAGVTRLPEAAEALRTGKWPRKVGMILTDGDGRIFELNLQGDRWQISAAQLPQVEDARSERELTEARLELVRALAGVLDRAYAAFLQQRVGSAWGSRRESLREWIRTRSRRRAAATSAR